MKVLVAEDEKATREYLCEQVRQTGHLPLPAATGREALATLLRNEDVGLILMDIVMPEMTGLDFVVEARAAGLLRCPVYAISGYDPLWVEGTGITGHLPKPVDVEQLRNVIQTAELVTKT